MKRIEIANITNVIIIGFSSQFANYKPDLFTVKKAIMKKRSRTYYNFVFIYSAFQL